MNQVIEARPASEVLAWSRQLVEPTLREAVDTLPTTARRIAGYHFGWWDADGHPSEPGTSGKALRPALVLLAARAAGGDPDAAVPAAVAVELVHNFSLIHDDMIDGDLTRRHRACVWSVFGTGAAVLSGSALLALALEVLAGNRPPSPPPAGAGTGGSYRVPEPVDATAAPSSGAGAGRSRGAPAPDEAVGMLSTASVELLEGQHADLAFENRSDVELLESIRMAQQKTGALLGCACALGATVAGARAAQVALLRSFGEQLGLAFQLADDLLGIWGDPAVAGKPVHSDLRQRKKSLPVVAALTSRTNAGEELAELYRRDEPMAEPELARAAELVDRAGGRAWCRARADDVLSDALRDLRSAVDPANPGALELAALARLAVYRDR